MCHLESHKSGEKYSDNGITLTEPALSFERPGSSPGHRISFSPNRWGSLSAFLSNMQLADAAPVLHHYIYILKSFRVHIMLCELHVLSAMEKKFLQYLKTRV